MWNTCIKIRIFIQCILWIIINCNTIACSQPYGSFNILNNIINMHRCEFGVIFPAKGKYLLYQFFCTIGSNKYLFLIMMRY